MSRIKSLVQLRQLPSPSVFQLVVKKVFHPNAECGEETTEEKYTHQVEDVPKCAARNKLKKCGRVRQIKLTRVISTANIERVIKHANKHLALKYFIPLDVDMTGHYLRRSVEELDGQQAINRSALYIC